MRLESWLYSPVLTLKLVNSKGDKISLDYSPQDFCALHYSQKIFGKVSSLYIWRHQNKDTSETRNR